MGDGGAKAPTNMMIRRCLSYTLFRYAVLWNMSLRAIQSSKYRDFEDTDSLQMLYEYADAKLFENWNNGGLTRVRFARECTGHINSSAPQRFNREELELSKSQHFNILL